ncbi:hypothetical protein MKW98_026851 [Papaver atlanticum]|uniref:Uncharacterized protein n=1 Tax=Papaver atlanticum TaxID=357466 RepID=A0AAD4S0F8_9MAGN|nr:hypothetical protein MKW98_026851 [Papaver atlanticum]
MGAGVKKKKCSRKVKSADYVDKRVLDDTVKDKRVVSTNGVETKRLRPEKKSRDSNAECECECECHQSSDSNAECECECHQSSDSKAECESHERVKVPLESDEKVKLSLLYVVHSITIDKSNDALAYQIKSDKPVGSEVTYKSQGMAHVLVVWGLEVLPQVRRKFGKKTVTANWRPHMHSVTCKSVINHGTLIEVLSQSKEKVLDNIMWHREDAKRLVIFGLCEGPLVNEVEEEEEDPLENENVVEKEDLVESETVFEPKVVVDDKDLKRIVIGEAEVFKSAVKGQLKELSVQVSNSHKTMLDNAECLTVEIKSMKDKIGHYEEGDLNGEAMQNLDVRHYEEGDFNGEEMQNLDVSPGDGSNNSELSPLYPYNPPNKEVDVSQPVAENICNSSTGKKRKRQENKPCTGPVAPVIDVSDDVTKGQGRAKRKINPAPPMLSPYTLTGNVAKKNPKKVSFVSQPTSEEPGIINYFEEDILDYIKEHGDNYNGDNTSLLSFHEYKLLLHSTGWLCSNLLHKCYPSNKSTGTWSYFETHLAFIEHMVRKIPVFQVNPAFATRYRCELAVQLFKKQFIEVNGTSGEE